MIRITSIFSAALILAASVGMPAPDAPPASKVAHSGEDYPCRNHACGCVSAAMCRTSCCCFGPGKSKHPLTTTAAPKSCCSKPKRTGEVVSDDGQPSGQRNAGLFTAFRALECSGVNWTIIAAGAWRPPPDPTVVTLNIKSNDTISAIVLNLSPLCNVVPVVPPPEFT